MINTAKKHILIPIIEAGYQAYIAGGTIRDELFESDIHDVDICTSAPEEVLQEIFPECCFDISKNMNLKVFLISVNGFKYEVARFRGNEVYSNHRQPDSVDILDDPKQDALRRDFTINALFMDAQGNIIDYVNGKQDIKDKVLRCVGDCYKRFDEDVLRILRGIRLAVKFDLNIEEDTRRAMFENCEHLATLPPERITDEIHKMMALGGFKFSRALKIMRDTGVLGVILPEVARLKDFKHSPNHHPEGDVLPHVIAAVASYKGNDPETLWAILLHDVGKAVTYKWRQKKDGSYAHTYYGHDIEGVPIIEAICERLCLPNRTRDIAKFCASKHMLCHRVHEMKPAKVLSLIEHTFFDYLMNVADCDVKSRGDQEGTDEMNNRRDFMKRFIESTKIITDVITGKFVMDVCNIEPGPKVGFVIQKTKEWICNTRVTDIEVIKNRMIELSKSN